MRSDVSDETVTGTFTRLAPWTLGARLFVMVMAIVATSVLTRTMSAAQWSEYSLLKNMWWYIWLLGQMGLSESTLRFGAELSARGDTARFKRLVVKVLLMQALAVAAMMALFLLLRGWLDLIFSVRFGFALVMTVILGGITIFKETLRQGYVAAYWVKLVALMSVVGAVAFPATSYVYISVLGWGVTGGLAGEATGYALMMLVFAVGLPLLKFKRTVPEDAPHEPVTGYRIFRYSGAIVSNNILTLLLGPQVLVFLIGGFLSTDKEAVGIYNLASNVPKQGLSFLILAMVPLITAMLTKAYYQDKSRLPELIRSYFKLMITIMLPVLVMGMLFLDMALQVLSGDLGGKAGGLALALLPIQSVLIVLFPVTASLNILEKAQRMILPRIILGIIALGMFVGCLAYWRSMEAVVLAAYLKFFLITPLSMYIAVRYIGGFYFPYRFALRSVLTCASLVVLWPLRFLWPYARQIGQDLAGEPAVGGLLFLICVTVISGALLTVSARLVGLFGPEEIKYFKNAKLPGMSILLKLLVPGRYRQTV